MERTAVRMVRGATRVRLTADQPGQAHKDDDRSLVAHAAAPHVGRL